MGLTHVTTDPDGTRNFHFAAKPVPDMDTLRRTAMTDRDLGRTRFARPQRYKFDPEGERGDSTLQDRRLNLR